MTQYPPRPLYESADDLRNEQDTAALLGRLWDCQFRKLPIRYHLDFTITQGDKAVAFCEMKTRSYTMQKIEEMGGYLLSLGKWGAAQSLHHASRLPFILVVKTLDGIWYATFTDFLPERVVVQGRTDRGDWQDIEPCVLIPGKHFKKVGA